MSVAEIKADAYKIFERIGENDLAFWSMVRAMAEQYVVVKTNTKTLEQQLIENIKFYSFIEEKDRLLELAEKLENESLTTEEQAEGLKLNKKVEQYAFHRLKNIMELAELRRVSVEDTLKEFAHLTYDHVAQESIK